MQLKPNTERALDNWLVPTWDSVPGLPDMLRFYEFVNEYQREHGFGLDESDLRYEIRRVATAKRLPFGKHQEDLARDRVVLAARILDFLKATRC